MARFWRAKFICVGWQVTLCDPIWQVTSRSSEMGFPGRTILAFTFYLLFVMQLCFDALQGEQPHHLAIVSIQYGTIQNFVVPDNSGQNVYSYALQRLKTE